MRILKTLSRRASSSTYFFSPLTINEESSAYCEMFCSLSPPGREISLSLPSKMSLVISWVRASPTIRKKYGTRGHPYLTPLSTLKLPLGLSFRLTAAVALPKMNLTHLVKSSLTPILLIVWNKNLKETLLYAFENYSLRKTVGCLEDLVQCKVSWIKTILSNINLRDRNAVCSGLMMSLSMSWSLNWRVLVKILYDVVSNVIDLQ